MCVRGEVAPLPFLCSQMFLPANDFLAPTLHLLSLAVFHVLPTQWVRFKVIHQRLKVTSVNLCIHAIISTKVSHRLTMSVVAKIVLDMRFESNGGQKKKESKR